MKFGVIVFPGTWSERDCFHPICNILEQPVSYIWHKETDLSGYDCVILPGGFSYGDYLRAGAIARFAPIMAEVARFAAAGKHVWGICNGFQILCEAGLLPGALMQNNHLQFRCQWVNLRVESTANPFTSCYTEGQVIRVPISHYEGNYYADPETLDDLESSGQIAFRYCATDGRVDAKSNPNGSLKNIAGITNRAGNVLGMMPHPERACEGILGGADGKLMFESLARYYCE